MVNDHLHEYLRVCSGISANHMWRDLERSRRLGIKWAGVPATREEFDVGLYELKAAGLAEQMSNGFWLWLPKPRVAVCEPRARTLFA